MALSCSFSASLTNSMFQVYLRGHKTFFFPHRQEVLTWIQNFQSLISLISSRTPLISEHFTRNNSLFTNFHRFQNVSVSQPPVHLDCIVYLHAYSFHMRLLAFLGQHALESQIYITKGIILYITYTQIAFHVLHSRTFLNKIAMFE